MTTKTISAAIVGAILIAALALYSRHEPQPGADTANKDRSTSHETTAAGASETRAKQRVVPAAQPQSPDSPAAPNDASPSDDRQNQPGASLPQASAPAPISEALEDLKLPPVPEILETERAFAAEAVDPHWSQETETHILGEIAQVTGLKLVTLRVECKTTLCRLRVSQQELSRANPFPALVDRLGLKPLWVMAVVDRNGVPTSLAYLERESTAPKGKPE